MAEQSVFKKDNNQTIDIEKKDGLLEELNLPPNVIRFIRGNATNLQIGAVVLVVLILAWTYYDYYSTNKQNNAAYELHTALQESDPAKQEELIKQVVSDRSGTGAAFWGQLELGHKAMNEGNYEEALAIYQDLAAEISASNPVYPLLNRSMSVAYENKEDLDQALSYYQKLSASKGFEVEGLTAQGRIYERKGMSGEALDSYRKALENPEIKGEIKGILTEKVNSLQAANPAS